MPMRKKHIENCATIAAAAPDPWREADFSTEELHHAWVALQEGKVAGFVVFRLDADKSAELAMIAVEPARRGRGLGSALLTYGLEQLVRAGAKRCLLEVRVSNKTAVALYNRLGFSVLARRPGLYSHPPEDGLLMEKIFAQAILTPDKAD